MHYLQKYARIRERVKVEFKRKFHRYLICFSKMSYFHCSHGNMLSCYSKVLVVIISMIYHIHVCVDCQTCFTYIWIPLFVFAFVEYNWLIGQIFRHVNTYPLFHRKTHGLLFQLHLPSWRLHQNGGALFPVCWLPAHTRPPPQTATCTDVVQMSGKLMSTQSGRRWGHHAELKWKHEFRNRGAIWSLRSDDVASRLANGSTAFIRKLHCH